MKVGLEIHQQLSTGKLFCDCPSELSDETQGTFVRRLHAVVGETGTQDQAARLQSGRGLRYRYEVSPNSCLVEADEEPPHGLNPRALGVVLTLSELLHAHVIDEVQIMRKTVVDGSNTSGFQRTALIAVDGEISVNGKRFTIPSICLEEDAARKVGDAPGEVQYRLDRLGIPLLEIATGPEISSGEEARDVAEALGALLRATRKVKRGLGTIREDLNVSIEGGARVEIKGVQELRAIPEFVENEVGRQTLLLELREKLRSHGASVPTTPPVDVSEVFRTTTSRGVKDALAKGGRVLALPLPGFSGLLGTSKTGPERLGRELADYARATGVGGILHSDELPAYGVTPQEVEAVRSRLGLGGKEQDAYVLVAAAAGPAERAIEAVRARAREALRGVPEETRDPVLEGRTRYSRPLPGRHRMYPETDIPPIPIDARLLQELHLHLPERPEETLARLTSKVGLAPDVARKLVREGEVEVFDRLVASGHPVPLVARLLTTELPALEAGLPAPIAESDEARVRLLEPVLQAIGSGRFAKEGLGRVLTLHFQERRDLDSAIAAAGLSALSAEELQGMAKKVVEANVGLLRERGASAFQPLMGDLMASVRGRRDGKEVAEVLRRAVQERLGALGGDGKSP